MRLIYWFCPLKFVTCQAVKLRSSISLHVLLLVFTIAHFVGLCTWIEYVRFVRIQCQLANAWALLLFSRDRACTNDSFGCFVLFCSWAVFVDFVIHGDICSVRVKSIGVISAQCAPAIEPNASNIFLELNFCAELNIRGCRHSFQGNHWK